jgi:hypothetical protein
MNVTYNIQQPAQQLALQQLTSQQLQAGQCCGQHLVACLATVPAVLEPEQQLLHCRMA